MSVLAIIPARAGSKGIPNKNFTPMAGLAPWCRAVECMYAASGGLGAANEYAGLTVLTTDAEYVETPAHMRVQTQPATNLRSEGIRAVVYLRRPRELAQDDTPMIAVVRHVLEQIPGPPDQKILLVQPTQPLRTPAHLRKALELLTPEWDSVVSVVQAPSPDKLLRLSDDGCLASWGRNSVERRQDARPAFMRDGTAYCFWRKTADSDIYGDRARALIIPAEESCPLDTPQDWAEAERRLTERER